MKKVLMLAFTLICLSPTIWAASYQLERELFYEGFEQDYQSLMCSHNMLALIESFKRKELSLEDSFIVHVRALNAPFAEVKAYESRGGLQSWSFHAFMIRKGEVYDFDFGDHAKIMKLSEYILKMFFPITEKKQKLLFQIKPAQLYGGEDFDGSMNRAKYPLQNFDLVTLTQSLELMTSSQ
jgi:hypothetical protein